MTALAVMWLSVVVAVLSDRLRRDIKEAAETIAKAIREKNERSEG